VLQKSMSPLRRPSVNLRTTSSLICPGTKPPLVNLTIRLKRLSLAVFYTDFGS
jgi:hypothetical protein